MNDDEWRKHERIQRQIVKRSTFRFPLRSSGVFTRLRLNFDDSSRDLDAKTSIRRSQKLKPLVYLVGQRGNQLTGVGLGSHFKLQDFGIRRGFSERVRISKFPTSRRNQLQALRGSFSAVSAPIFASIY